MFCQYCVNFPNSRNDNSCLRMGCKNLQIDRLRAHQKCTDQQVSAAAETAKSSFSTEPMPLNAALVRIEKKLWKT